MKVKLALTGRTIELPRWGRWPAPWNTRGTLRIDQITGLHELTPKLARRLSDYDLHLMPRVRTNDSVLHTVIEAEMRRRENSTARWALAVSIMSLVVAFSALALKHR